jgi:NAD(P)-dependent dehydrogenase (short-subunit alcohol dehydrogenase family)
MELKSRVALVTGASGGLGAVIAKRLAEEGVNIAITHHGHREEAMDICKQLVEVTGRRCHLVHLDQTEPASVTAAVAETAAALGRLDIVINNAAWTTPIPFADLDALTPEIWDRIFATCVRGPYLVSRAAAPYLKRQDQGQIVNISALIGLMPAGSNLALSIAKAAVLHLTKCLAVALAPTVRVNCVAPGLMEGTRISARVPKEYVAATRERAALKRTTNINDVASQVITFCRSDSTTGQSVVIDGGIFFH